MMTATEIATTTAAAAAAAAAAEHAAALREIEPIAGVLSAQLSAMNARSGEAAGQFAEHMQAVDAEAAALSVRVRALESAATEQAAAIETLELTSVELITELKGQLAARDDVIRALVEQVRNQDRFIGDIRRIVRNTKLVGLNASIEAAHAGVHGAGFAIVATEVQRLATNAESTAEGLADELGQLGARLNEQLGTTATAGQDVAGEAVARFAAAHAALVQTVSDAGERANVVIAEVSGVSSALETITTEVFGALQFQDISRQSTEQVQDTLARLAEHIGWIADRIDGTDDHPGESTLTVQDLQSGYVMSDQHQTHAEIVGSQAAPAAGPAIELF